MRAGPLLDRRSKRGGREPFESRAESAAAKAAGLKKVCGRWVSRPACCFLRSWGVVPGSWATVHFRRGRRPVADRPHHSHRPALVSRSPRGERGGNKVRRAPSWPPRGGCARARGPRADLRRSVPFGLRCSLGIVLLSVRTTRRADQKAGGGRFAFVQLVFLNTTKDKETRPSTGPCGLSFQYFSTGLGLGDSPDSPREPRRARGAIGRV